MKVSKLRIQVVPSVSGRDRWLLVWNGTIRKAWYAPRLLSFVSRSCGF